MKIEIDVKKVRGELSQERFAQIMCKSVRTVSRWETGENKPTGQSLINLERYIESKGELSDAT